MNLTKKKEVLILATLASIQFIHIVDFMVMMPLGPQFLRAFSIGPQLFSVLISAYTISAGVFGFLSSFFLNNIERKKALLIAMFGFLVGTFCCGLSHQYATLFAARVVTGAFGGVLAALVLSIVADIIPPKRRGKAMGIVMAAFSIASIVGVPLGLYIATLFTWEAAFYFLTLLGSIVFVMAFKVIPVIHHHGHGKLEKMESAITYIMRDRNQMKALSLTSVIMLGQFSIIPLISTFLVKNVGFTEQQLPLVYILGGIGSIVGAPLSGRLGDKFGLIPVFTVFSFLCIIPQFGITHLTRMELLIPLLVGMLLFIFSSARMVCGMALIVSSVEAKYRAGFMSINSCVQQLSAGIAALVSGLIVTQSASGELIRYSWVGYVAVVSSVVAIFVARRIVSAESNHTH